MVSKTWIDIALALIAAAPGTIAAISSLRNGRALNRHINGSGTNQRKRPKERGPADWYQPPNFS